MALVEKPFDELSDQQIDELGRKALAIRPQDWKHAETDNFILHYRRATEARKVAREVEYDIAVRAPRRLGRRRTSTRENRTSSSSRMRTSGRLSSSQTPQPPWAASFAHGDELYLSLRNTAPVRLLRLAHPRARDHARGGRPPLPGHALAALAQRGPGGIHGRGQRRGAEEPDDPAPRAHAEFRRDVAGPAPADRSNTRRTRSRWRNCTRPPKS